MAARLVGVPPRWRVSPAARPRAHRGAAGAPETPGPMDGPGSLPRRCACPGSTAERPISPSALEMLLGCPHRFLLGRSLRFRRAGLAPGPARDRPARLRGARSTWWPRSSTAAHGAAFCRGDGSLRDWLARADRRRRRRVRRLPAPVPARRRGRARARARAPAARPARAARVRLGDAPGPAASWTSSVPSGGPSPSSSRSAGASLYVRGRIDRIDVDGDVDAASATSRPAGRIRALGAERDPAPRLDLQLGVYGLVVEGAWPTSGACRRGSPRPTRMSAAAAPTSARSRDDFDRRPGAGRARVAGARRRSPGRARVPAHAGRRRLRVLPLPAGVRRRASTSARASCSAAPRARWRASAS